MAVHRRYTCRKWHRCGKGMKLHLPVALPKKSGLMVGILQNEALKNIHLENSFVPLMIRKLMMNILQPYNICNYPLINGRNFPYWLTTIVAYIKVLVIQNVMFILQASTRHGVKGARRKLKTTILF